MERINIVYYYKNFYNSIVPRVAEDIARQHKVYMIYHKLNEFEYPINNSTLLTHNKKQGHVI